ncbi:hypothetical protein OTU49_005337 [Cherax quadricarinatus]|uniref:Uncharacterized protein n=1 Tax=Cherax quadricarinatus TaxID=27406 RepID=A0AAW0WTZ6_CHEQU
MTLLNLSLKHNVHTPNHLVHPPPLLLPHTTNSTLTYHPLQDTDIITHTVTIVPPYCFHSPPPNTSRLPSILHFPTLASSSCPHPFTEQWRPTMAVVPPVFHTPTALTPPL